MSYPGFKARNHPQQTALRGPADHVDDRIADRYGPFTVDVAAAEHNAKCVRFYDRATDGLRQSWAFERVWCNPPYSNLRPWLEKAWFESERAEIIAMLLPANRTEQAFWQDLVEPRRDRPGSPLRTEFLRGRPRFLRPGQTAIGPNERPPFGCVLLVWQGTTR